MMKGMAVTVIGAGGIGEFLWRSACAICSASLDLADDPADIENRGLRARNQYSGHTE
jgi:hypothetical protein